MKRTRWDPLPSHPETHEQPVEGCGSSLWSQIVALPETAGRGLQAAAQNPGISTLQWGGIPVLAPLQGMSWEATRTLLNLFTKKQPGLREAPTPPPR